MLKTNCMICSSKLTTVQLPLEEDRDDYVCMTCERYMVERKKDKLSIVIGSRSFSPDDIESIRFFSLLYKEMHQALNKKLNKIDEKFLIIDTKLGNIPETKDVVIVWEKIQNGKE